MKETQAKMAMLQQLMKLMDQARMGGLKRKGEKPEAVAVTVEKVEADPAKLLEDQVSDRSEDKSEDEAELKQLLDMYASEDSQSAQKA
jgi:hypothetical protein